MARLNTSCLARVVHSQESAAEEVALGYRTLFCKEQQAVLETDGHHFPIQLPQTQLFHEHDTVFVSEKGMGRLLYPYDSGSQTLFITAKCNSNCMMCPYTSVYRRNATDYPSELLIDMVRYLPEHTQHLVVTGGEPTLIGSSFFTIMQAIKERFPNIVCLLLTNGRSFSIPKIVVEAVEHLPRYTTAAIPLHAASAAKHDSITQSEGSFRQTIHGISNLMKTKIRIEIRIVVFQQNLHEMLPIAKLLCSLPQRVHVVHFMAAEMCGNAGINHDVVWVDYNEAFQRCIPAIDLLIRNGIDVELYNFPLCSIPKAFRALYRKSISEYKIQYGQQCDQCADQPLCGGVFGSSLKYAESGMKPVTGDPNEH